jgi:serine/threonine phosphatase stp
MKSFYLTDAGKVRSHNEDSVIIVRNQNDDYLLAVADGMGGHRCGEVASSIAISYLGKHFQETFRNMNKEDAVDWIRQSVKEINRLIFNHAEEHPESKGMGTTLVLAISTNDYVLFGNIGDSSGFAMKDNHIHKITYDHTLVNLLVTAGELTEEQAKDHPKRNVLMKALGANDPVEIDIFDCDIEVSDILLCSDGLTNMLDQESIERVLLSDYSVEDKVIRLIKKAINRGGTDNVSVAYLERFSRELKEGVDE